jgi:hypothetical protein
VQTTSSFLLFLENQFSWFSFKSWNSVHH